MHQQTLILKLHSPTPTYGLSYSHPFFLQNPRLRISHLNTNCYTHHYHDIRRTRVPVSCKNYGAEVSVSELRRPSSFNFSGGKEFDVATLGNLCVDVVLNVPNLPPSSVDERKDYMEQLSKSPPDKKYWEAGGNCNMAIAASRLGLRCIAIGHVGDEIYGNFLLDVLHDEGINVIRMREEEDIFDRSGSAYETLLCWVLVDPLQRHGFCRYK